MKSSSSTGLRQTQPGSLKPQDVAVLLKILLWEDQARDNPDPDADARWTLARLAEATCLSTSEIHYSLRRTEAARLLRENRRVNRNALEELIIHGVKYVFVPSRGGLVRGIPTSYAAPPLKELLIADKATIPVWSYAEGSVRGISFSPLYPSAPAAAMQDRDFYELLTLVDVLRGEPRARERSLAIQILQKRLAESGVMPKSAPTIGGVTE